MKTSKTLIDLAKKLALGVQRVKATLFTKGKFFCFHLVKRKPANNNCEIKANKNKEHGVNGGTMFHYLVIPKNYKWINVSGENSPIKVHKI